MLLLLVISLALSTCSNGQRFPENFLFGTASSSYQIEGAWNADGKSENIWDTFIHDSNYTRIADNSSADISTDSYHKSEEDVLLLKKLGVDFYIFSLSWSRILPKGFSHEINLDGINYYNTLINLLIKQDITPIVTLLHWDTPQRVQELGGFTNSLIVDWFEEYAKVVFENYGNRIKFWLTFNDPKEMCLRGYGSDRAAPGQNASGVADYLCGHNVLKAHARVYHLYNNIYKPVYKGKVSIGLGSKWYEPATTSAEDTQAAKRALEFSLGWFAEPIYHPLGLYPKTMFKEIEGRSESEGFASSRLPQFHKDEAKYIRGTYDFFALNHYTTEIVSNAHEKQFGNPSYYKDRRVKIVQASEGNTSLPDASKIGPAGFQKLLKHIKYKYQNPQIFVTGNGFPDDGEKDDQARIQYLEKYLGSLWNAIQVDAVNVAGYAVWSFLDSFEWEHGYTLKYGLYHVDFTSSNRTRTPKASSRYYKDVVANKIHIVTGNNSSHSVKSLFILQLFFVITLVFGF